MNQLTRGEQKSLAYHRVVAEKLRADPNLISIARSRLQWYRDRNSASRFYYDQWERLLVGPIEELLVAMTDLSHEGCALRQENPFVDLVSQPERAAIYEKVVKQIESGIAV